MVRDFTLIKMLKNKNCDDVQAYYLQFSRSHSSVLYWNRMLLIFPVQINHGSGVLGNKLLTLPRK